MLYDVFICHASDDKDAFVRPLAERLREQHIEVWYDEFSLKVGDSLRRSIDRGLSQSRFGIIVLSPSFFSKKWSQWELDGLVSRQNSDEAEVILPVWHMIMAQDLLAYSPSLADKIAVQSSLGLDEVVRRLAAVIHPRGSTLVIARDHLLEYGARPPVISDDWWLDVAAASESNDMEGGFQEAMGWGRWGFPLPEFSTDPAERGWRLAHAAMQMMWQREADTLPITQITKPEEVHSFIESRPGLAEACSHYVSYLISYAPQLVIRTFGEEYEDEIESRYRRSVQACQDRRNNGDPFGSGLTTDGRSPGCDDMFALRDPEFGNLEPAVLACHFVQGDAARSGPPVKYYSTIDYAAWLLSEKSTWLPGVIRDLLTRGIAAWGVWPWDSRERLAIEDFGFEDEDFTGAFSDELHKADRLDNLCITMDARRDIEHRLAFSSTLLQLPEDGIELSGRLIDENFLEHYFTRKAERARRRAQRGDQ
jgi:hypothetical protein